MDEPETILETNDDMPAKATRNALTARPTVRLALCVLAMLVGMTAPVAAGEGSTYRRGSQGDVYGYKSSYQIGHHSQPSVTRSGSGRTRSYSAHYRSANSGFGWLGFRSGENNRTGYTGANTSIQRPHRANWYAKLREQRKWDEAQYKKAQNGRGAECGFTGAPAYCYRLQGPYPTEYKVVRY